MNTQAISQASSRRIGRSILAMLVGIIVGIVLSVGSDSLMHAIGLAPALNERWSNRLLVIATTYRTIYGVFAAYVIARLAPNRPMGHALVAGTLGLVVSSLGAAAAWSTTIGQHWYPVALGLTALPTAWLGAKLRLMQMETEMKTA